MAAPINGPIDLGRRRFLRRAATVVGVGLGITMVATPAWAPGAGVTKCTKAAPCYLCSGFSMYKCSCAGSSGYYTCVDKCADSYCKSYSRCA